MKIDNMNHHWPRNSKIHYLLLRQVSRYSVGNYKEAYMYIIFLCWENGTKNEMKPTYVKCKLFCGVW